jgi:hypothetical protein
MTYNFTFKTREEYFTYRQEWKERYFQQIATIRKLREAFKDAQRAFSKVDCEGGYDYSWDSARKAEYNLPISEMHSAMSAYGTARKEATALILERCYSRIEAANQRELRLQKAA